MFLLAWCLVPKQYGLLINIYLNLNSNNSIFSFSSFEAENYVSNSSFKRMKNSISAIQQHVGYFFLILIHPRDVLEPRILTFLHGLPL